MATLSLIVVALLAVATAQQSPLLENYLAGNVDFTARVYQEVLRQQNPSNFVVCPTSVQLILALTKYGAKGLTSEQLANAIRVPDQNSDLIQTIEQITPHLKGNDKYALHSANKIYAKRDIQITDSFNSAARDFFSAETEAIDFTNPVVAAEKMNQWVNTNTNGKINDLIDPYVLNNRTALVLLNAIYFKGKWVYEFDDHFTQLRKFQVNRNHNDSIQMMQMTVHLNYYKSEALQAEFVELPYVGKDITMTIVLPKEIDGLQQLERNIHQVLQPQPYTEENVHIRLPKFNIKSSVDFVPILKSLGVNYAFDDERANFTGISENRQKRLKIDKVFQKAAIELDETGTQATAATYTIAAIPISALYVPPPLPKFFEVNRPFIYYLKSPAGILFVGRYINK